ncbi:MAG: adenosylcobinamide amidohydrolase [Dehalococcoidales bacterium]|nr:adenosylcobinamide amidohydrolase [Dehalococcoidales bacterium]
MNYYLIDALESVNFNGITASLSGCRIDNDDTMNVVFRLPEKRRVLSTRDGYLEVNAAGENICPQSLWTWVHNNPKEFRKVVNESLGDTVNSCAMLYTGADPDYWALETRETSLMIFLTVDFRTNAMRAGKDTPHGTRSKSPGTINIFLFTDNALSDAAMSRSLITITEAKSAALQDNDIRSSYNDSLIATGTGTDNIIIVPGKGDGINRLRGHSLLSLDIGKAVYSAMNVAIFSGRLREGHN